MMRSFKLCTAHQILLSDQIKKNDMGQASNTSGGRKGAYRVLVGKPAAKNNLEYI
jgi:hypothetical protein